MTKNRYKCTVTLDNRTMIFKRYGETDEQVKTELLDFIKEAYKLDAKITEVSVDATYTPKETQTTVENANTTESTGQTSV